MGRKMNGLMKQKSLTKVPDKASSPKRKSCSPCPSLTIQVSPSGGHFFTCTHTPLIEKMATMGLGINMHTVLFFMKMASFFSLAVKMASTYLHVQGGNVKTTLYQMSFPSDTTHSTESGKPSAVGNLALPGLDPLHA